MHHVGKTKFYRRANFQVETQKTLGVMKMTKSAMNSDVYSYYSFCHYSLLNLLFSYLLKFFEFQPANLQAYRTLPSQRSAFLFRIFENF